MLVLAAVPLCLLLIGRLLHAQGLDDAANWAQLVSIPLAVLPLLLPSLSRWWRARRPDPPTAANIADLRTTLAREIRRQWEEESKARGLDDTAPIPIQWRMTEDQNLVDVPGNLTEGVLTEASSGDIAALVADFRRLRRPRLVILGGAGAGKTTLAVQILLELLRERSPDSTERVPLLLSAAGWDPARHTNLWAWVAERIAKDHPGHPAEVVSALAERGHVVPIIDGLDEISGTARPALLAAVHAALSADSQLILTSRADEYREAVEAYGRVLPSAVVIEPQPLSAHAAALYIEQRLPADPGDNWRTVLSRLRDADGTLAEVVSTPLGLWLLHVVYLTRRADPAPLLDQDRFPGAGSLRAHLFDRLVEATLEARPPSDRATDYFRPRNQYKSADVERWLRFLAANLDRRRTRDFDWSVDAPSLTRNSRPYGLASWVERAAAVTGELLERAEDLPPRWARTAVVFLVLLVVASCVLVGWLTAQVFGTVAGTVTGIGIAVAWIAVPARLFELSEQHQENGEVDWPTALSADWQLLRRIVFALLPVVTFSLAHAMLVAPAVAVPLALIAPEVGIGRIALIAALAGSVVGAFAVPAYLTGLIQAPGPGARPPWYGLGPGPGLRSGAFWGIFTGVVGGMSATLAYGQPDAALPLIVLTTATACAMLVSFRAVLTPILFSLTALGTALIKRPVPARDETESVGLWQSSATGQQQRFVQVGVLAAMVSAAAAVACRLLWVNPIWNEMTREGPVGWLAARVGDFDVAWTGHLRYVVAVVLAWLLTIQVFSHRSWRRWLVWLLIAVLVVRLWPGSAQPDSFRLTLTGDFWRLEGDFRLDMFVELGDRTGSGTLRGTLDLADLAVPGDLRRALLIWLGILVLGTALGLFWRIDGGQPRVWWYNTVTGAPRVLTGHLPADLVTFLDDAHRLGLLRSVGTTVYQFRHAEFQDHLARQNG
ncbi:NACHT domain-containing protein [Actinoplanes sp. LDG1-06]|uniref:NACHT domain-containing protein n=1 Tax=Paractinoplanes ovalisporus TaxID=2810368 RepID=A0ABS2A2U5_9ACTN|nr:NACHT domain-containing protein [Actinoplanes ovalisporus]MBM2614163.1 NACHT domain-containing protein [Actinoplanes ovalisporus]